MSGYLRRVLAGATMVVAASLAFTTTALAANPVSNQQAGYTGDVAPGFTKATLRFRVPPFTCPQSGSTSATMGAAWISGSAVATVGVTVDCTSGSLDLGGVITEADDGGNGFRFFPVVVGDVVQGTFGYNVATGDIRVTSKNVTTGHIETVLGNTPSLTWTKAQYGWFIGNPSAPVVVPAFTTIPFSNLTLDGAPAASKFTSSVVHDLYNGSDLLIHTSKISTTGKDFKLQYRPTS